MGEVIRRIWRWWQPGEANCIDQDALRVRTVTRDGRKLTQIRSETGGTVIYGSTATTSIAWIDVPE